jgi:hypothetical protein
VTPMRAWYALVAVLALIGLVIEYLVTIAGHPDDLAGRTLIYLSFFTILSNIAVLTASAGIAIGSGWASRPALRTAISVQITVVAAIFQMLLAGLLTLSPLGWWGNMLVHQLVPALWLIGWVAFGPHGGIDRRAPLWWLIYPVLYGVWTIAHGAATGWYPYPFLDIAKFGGARIALNMVLMGLFFAGLGYAFRWIDGRLARSRAPV